MCFNPSLQNGADAGDADRVVHDSIGSASATANTPNLCHSRRLVAKNGYSHNITCDVTSKAIDPYLFFDDPLFISYISLVYWQSKICEELNIPNRNIKIPSSFEKLIHRSAIPNQNQIIRIVSDGNCFFRTLSYFFCGDQSIKHKEIRKMITQFIKNYKNDFCELFTSNDIELAIKRKDGDWADDIEIRAAATLFNANINVYSYRYKLWVTYSPIGNLPSLRNDIPKVNIFIDHTSGVHFQPVLEIQ